MVHSTRTMYRIEKFSACPDILLHRRFRKRWRRLQILQFCGDDRRIRSMHVLIRPDSRLYKSRVPAKLQDLWPSPSFTKSSIIRAAYSLRVAEIRKCCFCLIKACLQTFFHFFFLFVDLGWLDKVKVLFGKFSYPLSNSVRWHGSTMNCCCQMHVKISAFKIDGATRKTFKSDCAATGQQKSQKKF